MKPTNATGKNQGEGDRVSARRYNKKASEFVAAAKKGPRPTKVSVDELVNMGRTVVDRAKPYVERAVSKIKAKLNR